MFVLDWSSLCSSRPDFGTSQPPVSGLMKSLACTQRVTAGKLWIGVGGESLLWLRLFPVLTSIAAIFPFLLLCREFRLRPWEINLALLLMAVNGYLIKYAQEVRMYSLLLFLSLCSLWLFVRFFRTDSSSRKELLTLCVVNLLLVYAHYAGWLVIALQVIGLLLWKRSRLSAFLMTVVAIILGYIPWLYAIAAGRESGKGLIQNIGWVTRPHARDLAQYFTLLNKPFDCVFVADRTIRTERGQPARGNSSTTISVLVRTGSCCFCW